VSPDLEGILEPAEMQGLADVVLARGGNINRILSDKHAHGVEVHQLNCTYYSALGEDDERYLAARAIQLFARGIPQLYYVGLLAGRNDQAAVQQTGEGRAVNRHDYSPAEIDDELQRPVVRRLLELIRLRATHPAFGGELDVTTSDAQNLRMRWTSGRARCQIDVNVENGRMEVTP
jgi:sucrose phosphorylase